MRSLGNKIRATPLLPYNAIAVHLRISHYFGFVRLAAYSDVNVEHGFLKRLLYYIGFREALLDVHK